MKPISQETIMGCAVACCASLSGLSYKKMQDYFDNGKLKEQTTGFYNKDIVSALNRVGIKAKGYSIKGWGNKKIMIGTIVFIKRSKKYPKGHFLLKTKRGWMNPWMNYPNINPARAGFQKELPGKVDWVIEVIR